MVTYAGSTGEAYISTTNLITGSVQKINVVHGFTMLTMNIGNCELTQAAWTNAALYSEVSNRIQPVFNSWIVTPTNAYATAFFVAAGAGDDRLLGLVQGMIHKPPGQNGYDNTVLLSNGIAGTVVTWSGIYEGKRCEIVQNC